MEIHTLFFFLNLASIKAGVLKGAVDALAELAKQHKTDAFKMGLEIANATGIINQQNATSYARGFLETADYTK